MKDYENFEIDMEQDITPNTLKDIAKGITSRFDKLILDATKYELKEIYGANYEWRGMLFDDFTDKEMQAFIQQNDLRINLVDKNRNQLPNIVEVDGHMHASMRLNIPEVQIYQRLKHGSKIPGRTL